MRECGTVTDTKADTVRAAGSTASGLVGGHAPAQTCPSARNKQPSVGLAYPDEVAAEEARRYLRVWVEESRLLSSSSDHIRFISSASTNQ